MRKIARKISLHRETLHPLTAPELGDAAGGSVGNTVTCDIGCQTAACLSVVPYRCFSMAGSCTPSCPAVC